MPNAASCIRKVQKHFASIATSTDELDGLMSFGTWRFNLRKSNTEPLVKLNIETKRWRLIKKKQKIKNFNNVV